MPALDTARKVGGNYTAIDNGDDTFDILDLPIFARVPAGAKRNEQEVGSDWMGLALQKNRLREHEGHLPPVHVYHSDDPTTKPEYAGKFRLKRVGSIVYEGEQVPALFADLVEIPREQFERIQKGALPYRSVEVHSWNEPEIDSLALMPSEVPFFRMAMTTIGKVVKRTEASGSIKSKSPALAFRAASRDSALILFKFKGEKLMAQTKTRPGVIPDKGAITTRKDGTPTQTSGTDTKKDVNEVIEGGDAFSIEGTAPGGSENAQVENFAEDGDGAIPDASGGGGAGGMGEVVSLLREILSHVKGGAPAAGPEGDAGAEPAPDPQEDHIAPVSGMRAAPTPRAANAIGAKAIEKITLRAVGPALARLKQVEAKLAAKDREETIQMQLREVEAELAEFNLDDETAEHFRKCASIGPDFLREAVDTFKRTAVPEPPQDVDDFERLVVNSPGLASEAVNTFAAKHPGPQAASWIRMQAVDHANWVKQSGSDITLEKWLETNWPAAGL